LQRKQVSPTSAVASLEVWSAVVTQITCGAPLACARADIEPARSFLRASKSSRAFLHPENPVWVARPSNTTVETGRNLRLLDHGEQRLADSDLPVAALLRSGAHRGRCQ